MPANGKTNPSYDDNNNTNICDMDEEGWNANDIQESETIDCKNKEIELPGTTEIIMNDVPLKPISLSLSTSGLKLYVKSDEKFIASKCGKTEDYDSSQLQCQRNSSTDNCQNVKVKNQKLGYRKMANNGNQNQISGAFLDPLDRRVTHNAVNNRETHTWGEMNIEKINEGICNRQLDKYNDTLDEECRDQNRKPKGYIDQTYDTHDEECRDQNRKLKRYIDQTYDTHDEECRYQNRKLKRYIDQTYDTHDEECRDQNRKSKRYIDQTYDTHDEECRDQNIKFNGHMDEAYDAMDKSYGQQSKERNATIAHRHMRTSQERMDEMDIHHLQNFIPVDTMQQVVQKDRNDRKSIHLMTNEKNAIGTRQSYDCTPRYDERDKTLTTFRNDQTKGHNCHCFECNQRMHFYLKTPQDQQEKNNLLINSETYDCNCNSCCFQPGMSWKTHDMLTCSSGEKRNLNVKTLHNCRTSPCQAFCGNTCSSIPVYSKQNETDKLCSNLQIPEEVSDTPSFRHISPVKTNETVAMHNNMSERNETGAMHNDMSEGIETGAMHHDMSEKDSPTFSDFTREQFAEYAQYLRKDIRKQYKNFSSLVKTFNEELNEQNRIDDSEAESQPDENEKDHKTTQCVIM